MREGVPGWVYVLEQSVRPGVVKVGATTTLPSGPGLPRVLEQTSAAACNANMTNTARVWQVDCAEPFWTEAAVHGLLSPWLVSRWGQETFAVKGEMAWGLVKEAAAIYVPGMSQVDYRSEVRSRCKQLISDGDVTVSEIFNRAKLAPSRAGRSRLYLWMIDNFGEFESQMKLGRTGWSTLSELFTASGLSDRRGEGVTAETARKTWFRVRRDYPDFVSAGLVGRETPPELVVKPARQVWPKEPGEIAPGVRPAAVEAPAVSVPVHPEPAGMPDYLTEQLSVGQRHLTKRGT